MKQILISPYSRKLRNGEENAKNYPYWTEVVALLKGKYELVQVGIPGEPMLHGVDKFKYGMDLIDLEYAIMLADTWISVDNFLHHFAWYLGKPGVAIFGVSDPEIFGHKENINLLKDKKYLRERQFAPWEEVTFDKECFVAPEVVVDAVKTILGDKVVSLDSANLSTIGGIQ